MLEELELEIACSTACVAQVLPEQPEICNPEIWTGRIDEVLFVPCAEEIDEAWILDTANWTEHFVTTGFGGRRTGKAIASYAQSNANAVDNGANCGLPSLVGVKTTWELSVKKAIIDRTNALSTHEFANKLQAGALNQYKLFARYCDNPDMILPIGKVALSKFNNTLPESVDDHMMIEYGFTWKQRGIPTPILVTGLGAILK